MGRVVYQKGRFKVIQTESDYVVRNIELDESHHSHFHNLEGAKLSIDLIKKRVSPHNVWWRTALKRLLSEEEFESLEPDTRQKYHNVQGGKGLKYKR